MKLQNIFSRVPNIFGPITSRRQSFDIVKGIIMNSGIAAIVIVAFMVPVLWYSIFRNWKARIMEMRRGRSVFSAWVASYTIIIPLDSFFTDTFSTSVSWIRLMRRILLVIRRVIDLKFAAFPAKILLIYADCDSCGALMHPSCSSSCWFSIRCFLSLGCWATFRLF